MDRNKIMWVVECCVLSLDNVDKKVMLEFGASEREAEIGIQLCDYLKEKEIEVKITNGY